VAEERSQALDRGLRVLELLADSPGLTVTELAERLDVARSVVYRLLATLEEHGFVRRGRDGKVRIGLGVLQLARRVEPLMRAAASGPLRTLAEATGATAHLTVLEGHEAMAVAVVEPTNTDYHVSYRVGARHPVDRGAAGLAILSARGVRPHPAWVVTEGQLHAGAHGIAAPLLGIGLEASVGVISLERLPEHRVGPLVVRAAAEVATALA
jgi:DNA-binding transcriptional ArsR family regulator